MGRTVIEKEILFVNEKVFGDKEEHAFNLECRNGIAEGFACNEDEKIKKIVVCYPKKCDILFSKEKTKHVLEYRGLFDHKAEDITYGDIMVAHGRIIRYLPKNSETWKNM